jgi:hypothetical protein
MVAVDTGNISIEKLYISQKKKKKPFHFVTFFFFFRLIGINN